MTFFDPLKPDRPEFDAIETDDAKTLIWSPPAATMADYTFPAMPQGRSSKVTKLPGGGNLVEDILLDAERRSDEKKAGWWRRLWSR